jgi:uncharacterized protein
MNAAVEEPIVFACGRESLVGILHRAVDKTANVGVLVVVGGPQYRVGSHRQFVIMARALARQGFAVMRFDYRGMGDSDGDLRTFESVREDIDVAIATFKKAEPAIETVVVWGLCDAASAALMHVARDRRVSGLVLVNPWVRSTAGEARAYVRNYYGQRLLQASFWRKVFSGQYDVTRSVREFARTLVQARGSAKADTGASSGSFIDRMLEGFAAFTGPVLVLISERDLTAAEFVNLCDGSPQWRKALERSNVRVVRLAGADHTFSGRSALDTATNHCLEWLRGHASFKNYQANNGRTAWSGV